MYPQVDPQTKVFAVVFPAVMPRETGGYSMVVAFIYERGDPTPGWLTVEQCTYYSKQYGTWN